MSEYLTICLPAIAANLAGMLIIYCLLSHAFARFNWYGRGVFRVVLLIALSQLFWLLPALGILRNRTGNPTAWCALWYGNWIVCGLGLVLLWQSVSRIPITLADSARLDGLDAFAFWKQTVFPFVRRDLIFIAVVEVMATVLLIFTFLSFPNLQIIGSVFESGFGRESFLAGLATFVTASLLGALPLIAIFFAAKRPR